MQTIYHAALEASCELAQEQGPYETYNGSPVSKGILQVRMPSFGLELTATLPAAGHVGCDAEQSLGLGAVARENRQTRCAQLATDGADADSVDCAGSVG